MNKVDELLKRSAHMVNQKQLTLETRLLEREPVYRRKNKRFAALCLSLLLLFTIVTISLSPQVLAYVVNLLQLNSHFQQVVEKGVSTYLGKAASKEGITLSMENLYVDQGELVFDMVQSFSEDLANKPVLNSNDVQLFINGRKLAFHSGGEFQALKDGSYGGIIYFQSNYGYEGGQKLVLPNEFNLTVKVDKIENIQGDWTIELPVFRKLSEMATRTFEPVVSNKVNDITITVSKVVMTPLSTSIDYEITVPENYSFTDPSSISQIVVEDDKGNIMGQGHVTGETKKESQVKILHFTSEILRTPNEIPKQLVIIPQRAVEERRDNSVIYYRGEPIEELKFTVPLLK